MKPTHYFSFLISLILPGILFGQVNETPFQKATRLKNEHRFEESFALFRQLLKNDSGNVDYLTNTSFLFCKIGNREKQETTRQSYFHTAEYLAKKAIALNDRSAEAHFDYAIALGRMTEFAGSKQKIANAKIIKTECERAISLNPKLGGAYHVLGRWHRTVADFNFIEKAMINALYGGVPEGGTMEAAIDCFAKAVKLEPNVKLNYYELAFTYYDRGKDKDDLYAKIWVKKAIEIPIKDEDDRETQKKCLELLKKVE